MKNRMTYKEWDSHKSCSSYYEIIYRTEHSTGVVKVKTSYYDKFIKKFTKAFLDAEIISFTQYKGELE